jgi:ABC-2 type transport system ATP-binding protein
MNSASPAISVHGLKKSYGEVHAVKGIDFEIQPGEVFGLLGPNGAGKTTTLSILSTVLKPDSGSILIQGRPPAADPRAAGNESAREDPRPRSHAGLRFLLRPPRRFK